MLLRLSIYFPLLLLLFSVTGCYSPQPPQIEPRFDMPESFSNKGSKVVANKWWLDFEDPELNHLIDTALDQNFSLQAAFHRLEQAEATYRSATGESLPNLNAENRVTTIRNRVNSNTSSEQTFTLGLTASYEVDLWGRIQSLTDAAELDMFGSEMDLETAAITLSSQVGSIWYQLSEQRSRLGLLKKQYNTNSKALEIIKLKFKTGKVGIEDVLQQQQLLELNKGEQVRLLADLDKSFHALNILIGEAPTSTKQIPAKSRVSLLPPLPETGVPAELLKRRPDVQAAYYDVEAANARLAAAIAAQYPALSISANLNTSSASTSDIFNDWFSNLAGNLFTPIFDGGTRKAEVERREAISKEKLNLYNQTMLSALGEVEDALTQEEQQRKYISHVDMQLELATKSMEQIKNRYLKGNENYQRVLTALVSMQNLEQTQLQARKTLINNRIELCRSLAGSWQISKQMN